MWLKSLIVQGFKSFRDRQVIGFDKGVTGIVGPNGCGKSNIVDAIFWVMGEQSAKHLRGNSMQDLIFAGSAKYPPSSFAEVVLVLANDEGRHIRIGNKLLAPSEVLLGRKLYRSGESEYRINGIACRMRDIQEVFIDSGAGNKSYAVIAQGEIDRLVNAKPIERRGIIEEVAGITKFKMRKRDSLRKMEETRKNLARLADLKREVGRSVESLSKEAERAKEASKLREEIEESELMIHAHAHSNHLQSVLQKKKAIDNLQVDIEAWQIAKDNAQVVLQERNSKRYDLITSMDEVQSLYNELSRNLAAGEEKLKSLMGSCREAQDNIDLRKKELQEIEGELKNRQEQSVSSDVVREVSEREAEWKKRKARLADMEEENKRDGEKKTLIERKLLQNDLQREQMEAQERELQEAGKLLGTPKGKKGTEKFLQQKGDGDFSSLEQLMVIDQKYAKGAELLLKEISAMLIDLSGAEDVEGLEEWLAGNKDLGIDWWVGENTSKEEPKCEQLPFDQVVPLGEVVQFNRGGEYLSSLLHGYYLAPAITLDQFKMLKLHPDFKGIASFDGMTAIRQVGGGKLLELVEIDSKSSDLSLLKNKVAELKLRQKTAIEEEKALRADLEKLSDKLTLQRKAIGKAGKEVEVLQASYLKSKEGLIVGQTLDKSFKEQALHWEKRRDYVCKMIGELEEKTVLLKQESDTAELTNQETVASLQVHDKKLKEFKNSRQELEGLIKESEDKIKKLDRDIGSADRSCLEAKSKLERSIENEEQVAQYILEKYKIDLRDGSFKFEKRSKAELVEMEKRFKAKQSKLNNLGEINWQAMGDFERQSERHEFLLSEEAQLKKSLSDLEKTVEHIDIKYRERFNASFAAVDEKFSKVFPVIFGGGTAKLKLLDPPEGPEFGEDDAGVDIVVKPPGKKMQNINLMSGGEKALTAVGLIFSIFLVRPSPFCFLDEVDAPLDDANIGRFNELLLEMSSESQFILITHNKRTMELNNTLYGVTMQEPGVSKAVSVQLH